MPILERPWRLAKRSVQAWIDDSAPSMGAALAFYTLFSMAPLLLVAISIAGFVIGRQQAQALLMTQLAGFIGADAAARVQTLLSSANTHHTGIIAAVVGTATLVLGATTVFAELKSDLDRIWHCKAEKTGGFLRYIRSRMLSFGMVLGIGFLLMVSLVVSAVLSALGSYFFPGSELAVRVLEFVASFLVITGLFAMIFKILPSTRIAWSDVWVGAAVTSLLFWVGKFLIGLYIGRAAVASAFGAAGTLIVVIVWVYYSAQIFFLGAEFTREYAQENKSEPGPN